MRAGRRRVQRRPDEVSHEIYIHTAHGDSLQRCMKRSSTQMSLHEFRVELDVGVGFRCRGGFVVRQ